MTEAESMTETETNVIGDTSLNGNIVDYESTMTRTPWEPTNRQRGRPLRDRRACV
jgi:hypothetical protein